jgi:K+-transporting ATPase KdpF subunit
MTTNDAIGLAVAVLIAAFLIIALLWPERL